MKINVIGLGYIGLPTALTMAASGYSVIGTDVDEKVVAKLNEGKITFEEKGLLELFKSANNNGIIFTTKYQEADIYIVAVPTPYDKFSKKVDTIYVVNAVKEVLKYCKKESIIIVESTLPPGTVEKFIKPIILHEGWEIGKDLHLVHAPERIIPGNMIYELAHNSRTIGAESKEIGEKVASVYRKITSGEVIVTDIKTAEMTKVVENTFRAVNIAFANELAKICHFDGMNVYEIIKICNMHPRVNILNPGPGVGGHCISVDPWFLVGNYPSLTKVIKESMIVNDSMPEYVWHRVREIMLENDLKDYKRVGLYGLTYKENVDDFRESPTLQLLEYLRTHLVAPLKVYDPYIKKDIVENQYHDFDTFLIDVDLIVIMVKHDEIKEKLYKIKNKIVLDTQNISDGSNTYKL